MFRAEGRIPHARPWLDVGAGKVSACRYLWATIVIMIVIIIVIVIIVIIIGTAGLLKAGKENGNYYSIGVIMG